MLAHCCRCVTHGEAQVVPNYEHGPIPPDPAWGAAYALLWQWMGKYYDDHRATAAHYEGASVGG